MQLAVGNIVEGKVTGITKFGAFVELPGGKTGWYIFRKWRRPLSMRSATM